MSLQCDIVYKDNGEIDYIRTESGQPSKLFNELTEMMGGDKQSALNLYALTESEDFIEKSPTVSDVMQYAQSTQKELTAEQIYKML